MGIFSRNEIPKPQRFIIEVSPEEWQACQVAPFKMDMIGTLIDMRGCKDSKEYRGEIGEQGTYFNPFWAMQKNGWPQFTIFNDKLIKD